MKKKIMNNFKIIIITIILTTIVVSSLTTVFAYSLIASDVGFTPKDTSWNVKNVEAAVNDLYYKSPGVPVGSIIPLMGNSAPYGYLACDGSTYNINDYVKLSSYIKSQFGSYNYFGGDGEETFAVPDLRGEFLRGTGTASRNTGSGATVGTHQDPTKMPTVYLNHASSTNIQIQFRGYKSIFPREMDSTDTYTNSTSYTSGLIESTSSLSLPTVYTSRPTNTSVLYIIKY